jgi:glutathione S-transferase
MRTSSSRRLRSAFEGKADMASVEEEDGFLLREANSIVRYLACKYNKTGVLEPKDAHQRALGSQWTDWQLSVVSPAIRPAFWGLIRTLGGQARHGSDKDLAGQDRRRHADHR